MTFAFWLSRRPRVLYCLGYPWGDELPSWFHDEPITLIVAVGMRMTAAETAAYAARLAARFASHNCTPLLAISDFKAAAYAKQSGVVHFPEHAVLDAGFWDISAAPSHNYDAVLVGQVEPHKRHGLAASVSRLCCLAHAYHPTVYHAQAVRRQLASAVFPYEPGAGWAKRDAVREFYRQSRTGLLVSGVEACSRATGEQQLCGLPIVSCGAHAGSLSCSDPDFIRIVPSTPSAVAAAVADLAAELAAGRIRAVDVRDSFLVRVNHYRHQLEERVGCVLDWRSYPAGGHTFNAITDWVAP